MTGTDEQSVTRLNISVLLLPEVVAVVDRLAREDDRSRSQMLRVLIAEGIKAREVQR